MPSPFPGMDPYLETPTFWSGFHQAMITYLRDAMNTMLPSGYFADIGERLYVVHPARQMYPDVSVFHKASPNPTLRETVAVATKAADPSLLVRAEPSQVREVFVEIRHAGDETRVVTAIELLSPKNKTQGEGRELYVAKQNQLLRSSVNFVEIDLLWRGIHTVAVPKMNLELCREWEYLVCLHRSGGGELFEVWTMTLKDRLPRIKIPLENELPDLIIDLQELFDYNYDKALYAQRIDYSVDASNHFNPVHQQWMNELLTAKGLRK